MNEGLPVHPDLVPIEGDAVNGYPCPKCETTLTRFDGGAWCSKCHATWRVLDEVSLRDVDEWGKS